MWKKQIINVFYNRSNDKMGNVEMNKEDLKKSPDSSNQTPGCLFFTFCVTQLYMMFVSIFTIIVITSCVQSSKQLEWYPKSPVFVINASSLLNGSSLNGLDQKIEYMQKLGVQNVVLSSVLHTDKDGVTDFQKTDEIFENTLKDLITKLKTNGMQVMLKLIPNHSSKTNVFFQRSVVKEPTYKDFYIWNSGFNDSVNMRPINNWSTINGESAWTWQESRKEYYLHQFSVGGPDFNFRNEDVVHYFEGVFKYWLDQGFDGLYLDKVQHLFKDKDFQNETISEVTPITNKYNSNLSETFDLLSKWGKSIKKNSGILIVSDIDSKDMVTEINMIHNPVSLTPDFTGEQLFDSVLSKTNSYRTWFSWEWVCTDPSTTWKSETIDAFKILSSLLPGIPFIKADPMLFENNHIPNITLIESTLKKLRSFSSVEDGSFSVKLMNNNNVFAFDRMKIGSESLIFAWNLSKNVTVLNLSSFVGIPYKVNLSLCTQSACSILPPLESKVKSNNILLAAESAVVISY